jgi:hypothetical protein
MASHLGKRRQRSGCMQDLEGPLAAEDFQANKRFLGHRIQLMKDGEDCSGMFPSISEMLPDSGAVLPSPSAHPAQASLREQQQQQQQQQHTSTCTDLVLYKPMQVDPSFLAHTNPGLIGALCSVAGSSGPGSDAYKALLPTALKGDTAQLKAVWHSLSSSQRKNLRGMWSAVREQGLHGSLPLLRLPSQDMPTVANGFCSDSGNCNAQPSCVIEEVADESAPPSTGAAAITDHQQPSPSSTSAPLFVSGGIRSPAVTMQGAAPPTVAAALPPASMAAAGALQGLTTGLGDAMAVDHDLQQQQQHWAGLGALQTVGSAEDMEM